jgi:phenylacetaldehyde dehydrogenase
MGPLIHAGHHRIMGEAVRRLEAHGGTALRATPQPDLEGYFFAPTLVAGCDPADTLEEIFGPVAAVHCFTSDAEALALANGSPYGLAGYVFSADEGRARAVACRIRAGDVKINGVSLIGLHPLAPRAAWGLSGLGEEGTAETLEFFRGTRVVGRAT